MHKNGKGTLALYLRNFVFGVEDSLVSTVGMISGIATAGISRTNILIAGIVLIFVEAFSMGVGSFLSEHSTEEYMKGNSRFGAKVMIGGVIMFISYFVAGFIPLGPYLIWPAEQAFSISIAASMCALAGLGFISAKMAGMKVWHKVGEMVLLGGGAILIGILVGGAVDNWLNHR